MSDQDQQNEFLPRRVAGFRNHLQDVLARSGATISDADREFLQRLIASPVDPNTLSDRDQRILSDIKLGRTPSDQDLGGGGRTLSDSDAAILEMLK
jgi:antitoxin component of RelBE/YafQ-DinJ toxin-antitoxin module